ncbi:Ubiquitin fusion degradation protein 4 [Leucoagaricus sp. SymC.cos]|nr:Ubiquitin fusion degradation protein 4 [Leucoagaricus sp. SymC.cos]
MDIRPNHHPEAESSSSASTSHPLVTTHQESAASTASVEQKSLRTSARVKAAKQKSQTKGKGKDLDTASPEELATPAASTSETSNLRSTRSATSTIRTKRTRDTSSAKGKGKEVVDEALSRSNKRSRRTATSNVALTINEPVKDPKGKKRAAPEPAVEDDVAGPSTKRPRTSYSLRSSTISSQTHNMPRKTSTKPIKGKGVGKSKLASSSRLEDEDVEMLDAGFTRNEAGAAEPHTIEEQMGHGGNGVGGNSSGSGGPLGDFDAAMAFLGGGDIRQFGSYMVSLTSRLKNMLGNIKATADPTTRLLTLQELSELLSISTEDTLAGSFPVEQYVRELVRILGGKAVDNEDDDDGDESLEAQVLACRCLANLMEALPGVAHTVVYHGAIPVLCSKLIEISYIDLAEQTLSTMEKISEEFPSSIVREGGLAALLNYLDFFSIAVQRTALQAAANCCRNVSPEHFNMVKESLVDTDLIRAVNQLLLPAGGSPLIASNSYTLLLRALATCARASPKITVSLLEADIVDTLYQILTGVLPSVVGHGEGEQGDAVGGQRLGGGLADMAVMENLAHRPKDQVEETLSLISELLPPLPKDGVFDHKAYTEKSLARLVKAKAKADRAAARHAAQASASTSVPAPSAPTEAATPAPEDATTPSAATEPPTQEPEDAVVSTSTSAPVKDTPPDRTELLRAKPVVVGRFVQLLMPILIDVYAASVITPVRIKTLTGLLKAVSFLDADAIKKVFLFVPIATFASSILSSKDHPSLVISALQLVDLLMAKVPQLYKPAFRREESGTVPTPIPVITAPAIIPGYKKLSSLSLDPEDAITLRCRVIQFKYLTGEDEASEDASFDRLRGLVDRLSPRTAAEQEFSEALWELADLFSSAHTSVSSFELLQGGVIDALLAYATDETRSVSVNRRRELFLDAFSNRKVKNLSGGQTSLAVLVKKLQESLTRMETFDVTTVSQNSDDSKRSSPSLLARQLRLRLVAAEDSDTPRSLQNIVVSIHAIATFQALHDYLRPRVSGLIGGSSRLSGMLAALAASGFGSPRSEYPIQKLATSSSSNANNASTSGGQTVSRRRSQRLAKLAGNSEPSEAQGSKDEDTVMGEPPVASSSSGVKRGDPTPSDTLVESELAADFTDDDEVDAEVFDDEDSDNSVVEKTITVNVVEDGSRIEAQTPDGTRVATPNSAAREGQATPTRSSRSARTSYAAALKAKPTDWHLEFSMDDHILPLDLTIYGAIHQHEQRKKTGSLPPSMIWQGIYTVKFKKVPGPQPPPEARSDDGSRSRPVAPNLSSLPDDAPYTKILRLLRVLYHLNTMEAERPAFATEKRFLLDTAFVNNKLTAKLTRQLEEPMIVASSCLPDWALDLPQHFPFLFPFATRYNFLQSTSFGYARLIIKWQSQQNRSQDTSRRDDGIGFLGRLQRQKVRISRKHMLESAIKVFELYGSSSSILEVEYFEEVGTGLGPTLEFYSLVSKEFARRDLKVWRDADTAGSGTYVSHPTGLYPAPVQADEPNLDGGHRQIHILRIIGQFIAKAMLDSRIIDLSFNKVFLKLILDEEVPLTLASLRLVDAELANSLEKLRNIAAEQNRAQKDKTADSSLPGGRSIPVTANNVEEYIQEVLDAILGKGIQTQVQAFKEGFSKVFPINDLKTFTAEELVMLFGNSEEDWGIETLSEAIKADHGFNVESRAIRDLIEIMSDYDTSTRRAYLQFITGSPKLPIGGFRGLNPLFTVVRKPHEAPLKADDYLPSVMTCVNYLKLPDYSSKDVMREKLGVAMQEGVGSFHLS